MKKVEEKFARTSLDKWKQITLGPYFTITTTKGSTVPEEPLALDVVAAGSPASFRATEMKLGENLVKFGLHLGLTSVS